ncbi:MAG: hypothetical protein KDL87_12165 [Verrucomicrobiae bacterium]|nr:hypothetical protein [Verrucomicrobiae bacterium]
MKKVTPTRRKRSGNATSKNGAAKSGRRKSAVDPEQSEWDFEEVRATSAMPRCEMTGVNVDLHLVAYRDPDTNEFTAKILGADYRHLVRNKTSLSVPVAVLSVVTLRQLEKLRKIPLGSRAAKQLREWLGRDSEPAWGAAAKPRQLRQVALDLPEDPEQPAFQLM